MRGVLDSELESAFWRFFEGSHPSPCGRPFQSHIFYAPRGSLPAAGLLPFMTGFRLQCVPIPPNPSQSKRSLRGDAKLLDTPLRPPRTNQCSQLGLVHCVPNITPQLIVNYGRESRQVHWKLILWPISINKKRKDDGDSNKKIFLACKWNMLARVIKTWVLTFGRSHMPH